MLFYFLLSFLVAVMAIDIRLTDDPRCDINNGPIASCINANAGFCCQTPKSFQFIGFAAVPGEWNVEMKGWADKCSGNSVGGYSNINPGRPANYCYNTPGATLKPNSGNYKFRNLEQGRESGPAADSECQLINALGFGDGKMYSLLGLTEDEVEEAVDAAFNGTSETVIKKYNLSLLQD